MRQLQRLGRELSDEDRQALRAYQRKYDVNKLCLYVTNGLRQEWEAKASAQQTKLSPWVVQQVQAAQRDASPEIEALRRDLKGLEEQVQQWRKVASETGIENSRLRDQLKQFESYGWRAMELQAEKVLRDRAVQG